MNKTLILFVDDQKICHTVMDLFIMRKDNYEMISAYSVNEAMEILATEYEKISVIISDIRMNDRSGHDLLNCVYDHQLYKDIPFILQSGLVNQEKEVICQNGKVVTVIYKPYKGTEILGLIDSLVG